MRYIEKQEEPKEFITWKKKHKPNSYSDLTVDIKNIVKQKLLQEQKFLCCYCETHIDLDSTTIEHLESKVKAPKLQLSYSNFLASCNSKSHCSHKRGNKELNINPLQIGVSDWFKFYMSFVGKNHIIEIAGNEQVIQTLNLNDKQLQRKRGKTLMGLLTDFGKSDLADLSTDEINQIIDEISVENSQDELHEFVTSINYVLNNYIFQTTK